MVVKKAKVVDKWKLKKWYTVLAPKLFESRELCEVVANDDKVVLNRIIKTSLLELMHTNSQTAMFTTLKFRVTEVNGNNAHASLIGHEVSPTFIKTFARRGKSLIHRVTDVKTKDNETVRVKVVAVTAGKISETAATNMRYAINDEILKNTGSLSYDELMQEILYGRLVSKLFNRLKQITMMRRVEIRKTEKTEVFK